MEDVGIERVHARPLKLFELSDWAWESPGSRDFTLFVVAQASADDATAIRRFAAEALAAGCAYVCAWGQGCELVHDVFDEAAIAASLFVVSTSHDEEELHQAVYFALVNAIPEDVAVASDSPVVLGVEEAWISQTRALIADQAELARLWLSDE